MTLPPYIYIQLMHTYIHTYIQVYNRTIDMTRVHRNMDGLILFDDARVNMRACVLDESLHFGVRAIDQTVCIAERCLFACEQGGLELLNTSCAAVTECDFHW